MDIGSSILRMATLCRHLGRKTANFTDISTCRDKGKCKNDGQMSKDAENKRVEMIWV